MIVRQILFVPKIVIECDGWWNNVNELNDVKFINHNPYYPTWEVYSFEDYVNNPKPKKLFSSLYNDLEDIRKLHKGYFPLFIIFSYFMRKGEGICSAKD